MQIKPLPAQFPGLLYDGERSLRLSGQVRLSLSQIEIELGDRCFGWNYADCKLVSDGFYGDPARIECSAMPSAALLVEVPEFVEALGQHYPRIVERPWWDTRLTGWASIMRSGAGVLLLGAGFYYFGIGLLAEAGAIMAPRSVEEKLGTSTVQLIAGPSVACKDSAATALLGKVESRLFRAAGSDYKFRVIYAKLNMVNAFAAPGGSIVVSDYLVRLTESPEEYAGVLAHEIQHVLHRDSMRAITRELGGNVILAMLSVDPSTNAIFLNQSTALLNLSFSRDAESAADLGAVELLEKARLPANGLILFLNRLIEEEGASGNLARYLSTHPDTKERIASLRRIIREGQVVEPVMSREEWKQAQKVCED
ncbi:MAG: M48 family metallopeptidase [Acidobacteria bacterium]|nr:M48 family metallopeptidase [Acidobacteriota bacterium]